MKIGAVKAILEGINEILPIWGKNGVKFGTGDVQKNVLSDCEFCEKQHNLLSDLHEVQCKRLHIMLLSICKI
jgi:hypothetical protein